MSANISDFTVVLWDNDIFSQLRKRHSCIRIFLLQPAIQLERKLVMGCRPSSGVHYQSWGWLLIRLSAVIHLFRHEVIIPNLSRPFRMASLKEVYPRFWSVFAFPSSFANPRRNPLLLTDLLLQLVSLRVNLPGPHSVGGFFESGIKKMDQSLDRRIRFLPRLKGKGMEI